MVFPPTIMGSGDNVGPFDGDSGTHVLVELPGLAGLWVGVRLPHKSRSVRVVVCSLVVVGMVFASRAVHRTVLLA